MKRPPKKNDDKKAYEEFIIEEPCELMQFLIENLKGKSRNNIKSLLSNKNVLVNNRITTQYNTPLTKGQIVRVSRPDNSYVNEQCALDILYEDNRIIVVDKPAGLLSISTDKERERTAYHLIMDYVRIKSQNNRIYVVHRLDRDTSGVLVFAKDEEVKLALQENWADIVLSRGYTAVVEGHMSTTSGEVKSWLKETKTHFVYSSHIKGDGLEAITKYTVLHSGTNYSLLDVRIETGRKNQIRVHMRDLGHPITGDKKYDAETNPLKRLALHAHLLEIKYPVTGEIVKFEAKIPKEFKALK